MVERNSRVTVYVRGGDAACAATVQVLQAGGVAFDVVDLEHPAGPLPRLRQIRDGVLPVVTVGDAVWGGHLPGTLALLVSMRGTRPDVAAPGPVEGAPERGER